MSHDPSEFDPLDPAAELVAALEAPELFEFEQGRGESDIARLAAYEVARALGYCRLFGAVLEDDVDGTLPPDVAIAAATWLARQLAEWTGLAESLPVRCDEAAATFEVHSYCCDLLEWRMDAWAASESVQEAYVACVHDSQRAGMLQRALGELAEATAAFDEALEANADYLAITTQTHLLDHWRARLVSPYKELPWWLGGVLEAELRRIEADVALTLPGNAAWPAGTELPGGKPTSRLSPVELGRLFVEPAMTLAASGERMPATRIISWVEPGEPIVARLWIPVEPPPAVNQHVVLDFSQQDAVPERLVGCVVDLEGQQATIDAAGKARFLYDALRSAVLAAGELRLVVETTPWSFRGVH